MCLDVDGWNVRGNANVHLWDCNGDPDQVWSFTRNGELFDAASGRALDVAGRSGQAGANVGVYRAERKRDQKWDLVQRGPGVFELVNRKHGLCLDVEGVAGARGQNVLLWGCDGGADQLWSFQPVNAAPVWTGPVQRPAPAPRPVPLPRPPPPVVVQPPVRAMVPQRFQSLLGAIDREHFSQGKLTVISQAASQSNFRVAQVEKVIRQLSFSSDKLRALELLAPRMVDRQNAFQLYDAFTFSSDKAKARAILQRNGI
jgi:hypothetical protein